MSILRDREDREQVRPSGEEREQVRPPGYEEARRRLEKQRKFRGDLVAYTVINAFLIVIWAVTGAGYFWPGWVLGGWGALLFLDWWNAFQRRPVTETDIEEEMRRRR